MAFTKITAAGIGSTETVTLDGVSVINNESIGGNLTVTGNATIGGVLTYEDVTNVDSVGVITARAGVLVGSGITLSKDGDIFATGITTISENLKVGTGVTISPDGDGFFTGVVTATTFKGDGSQLSNVTSTTINNNANNRLITGSGTANTLEGESELTYDSGTLNLVPSSGEGRILVIGGEGEDARISLTADDGDDHIDQYNIESRASDNSFRIDQFSGGSRVDRLSIDTEASGGNVTVHTGNLKIGTSGKGIDFSAERGSAAGSTSALLDDYEQGSFTATMSNGVTLHSGNDVVYYIKVGNLVTIQAEIRINSDNNQADTVINNLPFVATNHSTNFCPGPVGTYDHQLNSGTSFAFVKTTQAQSTASFQCAGQDGTFRNLDARDDGYLAFTLVYFTTF